MATICLMFLAVCVTGQQASSVPVVKLSTVGENMRGLHIRGVDNSYAPADATEWLRHWEAVETLDFHVDEALALIVTERFPVTIRTDATNLLIKKLSNGFEVESDGVVRRILSTRGDRATCAYALLIALNCGRSGGFLIRKYVEILLDHNRPAKDASFICEQLIDPLLLLDEVSIEVIANQLLFVATQRNAPANSRASALKAFQTIWLAEIAAQGKLTALTKREMENYAESVFTNDDEMDLVRVGAFEGMPQRPILTIETGNAAIRILNAADQHSIELTECAMRMLPAVPLDLTEEAVKVALKIVRDRDLVSDRRIEMVRFAVKTIEKHAKDRKTANAIAAEVANDSRMIKASKHRNND